MSGSGNKFLRCQPALLLIFITSLMVCTIAATTYYARQFLPAPVAWPAAEVTPLFNATCLILSAAFLVGQVPLFIFAYRFRERQGAPPASYIKGHNKLELGWTLIPAITFIGLFVWGQVLWKKINAQPAANALMLEVTAEQFSWRARYPGEDHHLGRAATRLITRTNTVGLDTTDTYAHDDFIPIQMHIPKGREVNIRLRAKDVIHSFFIPHLGVKMDAVPGMPTTLHFTPTRTTRQMRRQLDNPTFDYEIACAELCGRMHFAMKFILVVDEPDEFEQWYARQHAGAGIFMTEAP